MKIMQIRNATNRIEYAGKVFLVDPWLCPRHQFSFVDIPGMPYHVPDHMKENLPMPFYNLPMPVEEVLKGVDCYLVTHIHPDHIDISPNGAVGAPLHKDVPVICQNEGDAAVFRMDLGEAKLISVPARHGTVIPCGDAIGVNLKRQRKRRSTLLGTPSGIPR